MSEAHKIEQKMDLKEAVGMRSERLSFQVTEARLKQFCEAVGAPFRGEAPPTFMTLFRDGEFKILAELGFPLAHVLHADQEYRYLEPILAGDELDYETVLLKAFEKNGSAGSLRFLVYETEVRARRGVEFVTVGTTKTTVIVR